MAEETIRDVVIRTRIEVDKRNPFAETKKGLDDVRKSEDLAEKGSKDLGKEFKRTGDIGERGAKEVINANEKLIQSERRLAQEIDKRAQASKRAGSAGSSGAPRRGFADQVGAGFGRVGQTLDLANNVLSKVALPVTIVAMAPQILTSLADTIKDIRLVFDRSDPERALNESRLVQAGDVFGRQVSGFSDSTFGKAAFRGAGILAGGPLGLLAAERARGFFKENIEISEPDPRDPNNQGLNRDEKLRKILEDSEKALAVRRQYAELVSKVDDKQLESLEKQRDILTKHLQIATKAEAKAQAALDKEKSLLEDNKKQFGLLNRAEQQTVRDISEKVRDQGFGALNKEEIEIANKFGIFRQSEFADQNADAGGFEEIIGNLGIRNQITKLEEEVARTSRDRQKAEIGIKQNVEAAQKATELPEPLKDALKPFEDAVNENRRKILEQELSKTGEGQRFRSEIEAIEQRPTEDRGRPEPVAQPKPRGIDVSRADLATEPPPAQRVPLFTEPSPAQRLSVTSPQSRSPISVDVKNDISVALDNRQQLVDQIVAAVSSNHEQVVSEVLTRIEARFQQERFRIRQS